MLLSLFKHPGKVGKLKKKKRPQLQELGRKSMHHSVISLLAFFPFFIRLFSGTICQMARLLSYTFDLTGDFIRVRFEVIRSFWACSLTPAVA